jgi:ELWxxDGT repeat protein
MLLSLVTTLYATKAQPVLVADFNPGPEDGLDEFTPEAFPINDLWVLNVVDPDFGVELGVFENGEVKLIKDINPGADDARPRDFVYFNDLIYFVANIGNGATGIWSTDGTEEGTNLAISINGNPRGLIVSDAGDLFFNAGDRLFRTSDGITTEELIDDVDFEAPSGEGTENYTTYQNGIAFFRKPSSTTIQLYAYTDSLVQLGEDLPSAFAFTGIGLSKAQGGLVFSHQNSSISNPEVSGVFAYQSNSDEILKFPEVGEIRRFMEFNDEVHIGHVINVGYYAFTADPLQSTFILPLSSNPSLSGPLRYAVAAGKLVFNSHQDYFSEIISITDGTIAGTNPLVGTENSTVSNMIAGQDFVFFASGIQNGSETEIYAVNAATNTTQLIYLIEDPASLKSVQPLFFREGRLYFIGNVDDEVGRELYYIETGIVDPPLTSAIEATSSNLCAEDSIASLTVTVAGGVPPYSFQWEPEWVEGSNPMNLPVGLYHVTVSDNSISPDIELSIEIGPEPLSLSSETITDEMNNQLDGSISVEIQGGTPPYQLVWNTDPQQMGTTIENLSAGTYMLTITDANDCSIEESFVVDLITAVTTPSVNWLTSVYPNPSKNILYLETESVDKPEWIYLYNDSGEQISRNTFVPQLDISMLPSGHYQLKLVGKKGSQVISFIKI